MWHAKDIAIRERACAWMPHGFMSVNTNLGAGKAFLRSLYQQYAAWDVDFGTYTSILQSLCFVTIYYILMSWRTTMTILYNLLHSFIKFGKVEHFRLFWLVIYTVFSIKIIIYTCSET